MPLSAVLGTALITGSCGGGSVSTESASPSSDSQVLPLVAAFTGIESVEKAAGGTWVLRWTAVPQENIVYAIYETPKDREIDFNSPLTTARGSNYIHKPRQRYTASPFCFSVRVANVPGDSNKKSICVSDDPIFFAGADSLSRLSDGNYMLTWPKLSAENVVYAIYERQSIDQFNFEQPSFDGILNNFFGQLSPAERGVQFCYVVRYFHADLPADINRKELCTAVEAPIEFHGISDLFSVGNGAIKAKWDMADSLIVKSYRIYQGSDFREILRTVPADVTEAVIEGLVAGRQYSIGVRALDAYGREDRNIRIRAIVTPAL